MMTLLFSRLSLPRLLLLCALASAAILSGALIGQYGFDLFPCHLCLLQRYPYMAVIVLGGVGALLVKDGRVQWWLAVACAVLFAVDAGIAIYHTGVEMGIFTGPSGCTSSGKTNMTLEEIRAEIMGAPLVSCDQAMAYIFGLSMATWNAIAAGLLAIFTALALHFFKKKTAA
jgi:disulfide bond formation protein DsbB